MSFSNPPSHPLIMPSEETTLLVPEANSLNWRRECCRLFTWGYLLWIVYFLLLVTDVVVTIHSDISSVMVLINFMETNVSTRRSPDQILDFVDKTLEECILACVIDTLNCWIFLRIVTRSPHFVGCLSTLRNLICLSKFWTLILRLALYVTATFLTFCFFFPVLQRRMTLGCALMDVLHAFTIVALVGILNDAQVRNLGHSRYNTLLLKGALVVFFIDLTFGWICAIFNVTFVIRFFAPYAVHSNNVVFLNAVADVLILPFAIKMTDLIWIKIFHDDKCIIGKYKSNGFNRQNTLILAV